LVQWDCCEGTLILPLLVFSSHHDLDVRMTFKLLQCWPTVINWAWWICSISIWAYGMVLNLDATKHCICWHCLSCL
jgi:hypothetical protein